MLSDFLNFGLYFGQSEPCIFHDDLNKHYDQADIRSALKNGDLEYRIIRIGPDSGRILYSLSSQARHKLKAL